MQIWTVTVNYRIYDGSSSTSGQLVIKRKAKDSGTAMAIVSNLITTLSNVDFDVNGTAVPYLTILSISVL